MTTYETITSAGRKTKVVGYFNEIIASLMGKRTSTGVYSDGRLICIVDGREVLYAN